MGLHLENFGTSLTGWYASPGILFTKDGLHSKMIPVQGDPPQRVFSPSKLASSEEGSNHSSIPPLPPM